MRSLTFRLLLARHQAKQLASLKINVLMPKYLLGSLLVVAGEAKTPKASVLKRGKKCVT